MFIIVKKKLRRNCRDTVNYPHHITQRGNNGGGVFFDYEDKAFYLKTLSGYSKTGRPLGTERFIKKLEKALDRGLLPKKAGRPRKKNRV